MRRLFFGLLVLLIPLLTSIGSYGDEPKEFATHVSIVGAGNDSFFGKHAAVGPFRNLSENSLIISEKYYGDNDNGRVNIFFDADSIPNGQYNISSYPADVSFIGQSDDQISDETVFCDFNGDGYSDAIFNRTIVGGRDETIFVFYGGPHWTSGTVITDLDNEADVVIYAADDNPFRHQMICGDVNGDQYDDLLTAEEPLVILGSDSPSGTIIDLETDQADVRFTGGVAEALYYPLLADINGDGTNDFVFSHDSDFYGILYIWFGFDDYTTPRVIDVETTPPDIYYKHPLYEAFFRCLDAGDWNGDGRMTLFVEDPTTANFVWSSSNSVKSAWNRAAYCRISFQFSLRTIPSVSAISMATINST